MDLANIDPRFIDVDFAIQPEFVFGDKGSPAYCDFPNYGDTVPVIPEDQWKMCIEQMDAEASGAEQLVTRIYNQQSEGSCVANACSQAHEICQAKQYGKSNVVHLSAMSLYKRIGSSPGSGAMVSDGLQEMADRGVLPLNDDANKAKFGEHVMPNTGWSNRYPSGWESTAAKFKASEWFICRSVGELMTALLNRHPVVVGRAGHSICYTRPAYRNGNLGVVYVNSWGGWGFGAGDHPAGFGFDSMGYVRSSSGWAFALRSVTTAE